MQINKYFRRLSLVNFYMFYLIYTSPLNIVIVMSSSAKSLFFSCYNGSLYFVAYIVKYGLRLSPLLPRKRKKIFSSFVVLAYKILNFGNMDNRSCHIS